MPNMQMNALLVCEALWQMFRYDFAVMDTVRNRVDFAGILADYMSRTIRDIDRLERAWSLS